MGLSYPDWNSLHLSLDYPTTHKVVGVIGWIVGWSNSSFVDCDFRSTWRKCWKIIRRLWQRKTWKKTVELFFAAASKSWINNHYKHLSIKQTAFNKYWAVHHLISSSKASKLCITSKAVVILLYHQIRLQHICKLIDWRFAFH